MIESRQQMARLNSVLMLVLADLERRAGSAHVVVTAGSDRRALHVASGELVRVDSNVVAERLGDMLAAEGRLDPVLIEPVANEAKKQGHLIGDQLVADGLLEPAELTAALERQVELRFASALFASGNVVVDAAREMPMMVSVPLGAAMMSAFRARVPLEAIEFHLADPDRETVALDLKSPAMTRLELGPAQLKVCNRLASGDTIDAMVATGIPREPALRLAGALNALRLWG
jgi:hypothetical protein